MNLSNTQLFQGLQEQEITLLLDCLNAVKRSYKKGETILSEGNITENIGIVLSGMVIISCNDIWGNNSALGNVSTGSVFAEAYACIPGQAMLVTVSAIEDTEILFLNVGRVAKQIVEDNRDVVIVCSGTDDNFSLDDALCAGEIIKRAVKEKDIELSDMAIGLKFIAENSKDIPTTLKGTKHYEYLKSIGFTGDMEHCFTMDKYDILPFYNDGKIIVKE